MPIRSKKPLCVCFICTKFKMCEMSLYQGDFAAVLNEIYR